MSRRRFWHPILVPLPILAIAGTAACDLAFLASGDPLCARASLVLARVAGVAAPLAAAAGLRDLLLRREVRESGYGVAHFLAAAALVIGSIWSIAVRGADNPVSSISVIVSVGNAALLTFVTTAGLRLRRTRSRL